MLMRRQFAIAGQNARHPFLSVLPPHVRALAPTGWRETLALTRDDVRGFATSYIACLVAVAAFIF